jgi:phosphate transport system protein
MEIHFDQELSELKEILLRQSAIVEKAVAESLKAFVQRDAGLAQKIDTGDDEVDALHMEIDERCVNLIARRQPLAKDLRFILMVMKISSELERIGDQAVNIAHRVLELDKEPPMKPAAELLRMGEIAQSMVRDAMDAFVYGKPEKAREVIQRDDQVDTLHRKFHKDITALMIENSQCITRALGLKGIAHNVERLADYATNIAEEIIYLCEAKDIRHHHDVP